MPPFPSLLRTPRLEIRAPDPAAAPLVNAAIRESYDALHAWLPWADHVPTVAETREHLERARAAFQAAADYGLLIWDHTGSFVGAIGVHDRSRDPTRREIGYWIRRSAAGRGYATEAVRGVTTAAFTVLALTAIEIHTSAANLPSRRVAERAGYRLVHAAQERLVYAMDFTPES